MTDPRDVESGPQPEIKRDQEMHPPRRHDDPDAVVDEEERFGMAIPVIVVFISVIFLIVIALYWLN